jgi:glucosamine 6-phosphate synthetase-like amidotransferase/phosphosugar isomerase protein
LEYRGYDSAGIALGTSNKLFVEKKAGKLANLEGALVQCQKFIRVSATLVGRLMVVQQIAMRIRI